MAMLTRGEWRARAERAERELAEARAALVEHEQLFELRWAADVRAIKAWRIATGREMVSPDHVDLCVFLMAALDTASARLADAPGGAP